MKTCHYCYRPITKAVLAEKAKRKADNARASRAKALANGNTMGRVKMFNRDVARELRDAGFSYRQIGDKFGVSATAIHRALNSPQRTTIKGD